MTTKARSIITGKPIILDWCIRPEPTVPVAHRSQQTVTIQTQPRVHTKG
jgi:hypothetical protein